MNEQMIIEGSPFEKKVTLNAVARRNVCRINTTYGQEHDVIISAFFEDDGINWLQGVVVNDLIEGISNPSISNIAIRLDNVASIEFLELSVYDLEMTKEQATSIMQRTDIIVKVSKSIVFGDKDDQKE